MLLARNVKQDLYIEYKDRLVGFVKEGMLVAGSSKDLPPIPVRVKCLGCGSGDHDTGIVIPGDLMVVNPQTGLIVQETAKILPGGTIYAMGLCPKCEWKRMLTAMGAIICGKCGKALSWMQPGLHASGFLFRAGETYHADGCFRCDKEQFKSGEGGPLTEVLEYLRKKGKPLDKDSTIN